tara:strand:- start:560 stop:1045 length:486 start_codon:yes stop_codon:yes gene_type:complete
MNSSLNKFLNDNGVNPSKLSDRVLKTLSFEDDELEETQLIGGFLRKLANSYEGGSRKLAGGSTVLPSEYFGKTSGSYFTDVTSTNVSDASPVLTRPAMTSTFKGGASGGGYKFLSVKQLKKVYKSANKEYAKATNFLLEKMLKRTIKGGKITQKSLKAVFD